VAVADLDGDSVPDLVTANFLGDDVSVLLGNGDGSFQSATAFAVGEVPSSVAMADLDGDMIPDLVTANRFSGDVSVLLGNGDGTFQSAAPVAVGDGPASVIRACWRPGETVTVVSRKTKIFPIRHKAMTVC
jgi:hypothetical protein